MNFKFMLGDLVKDRITSYKGIIISRSQWLTNCNTYGVKSQKLEDGKPMDAIYFDEPNLILIKSSSITPKQDTGGPERLIIKTNRF